MIETLGERITYLRKTKEMTQAELMQTLGIHQLSRFENNQREPNISTLISIAHFFNVSLDWLLTGQEFDNTISEKQAHILELFEQLDFIDQAKIEGIMEYKAAEAMSKQKQQSFPSPKSENKDCLA